MQMRKLDHSSIFLLIAGSVPLFCGFLCVLNAMIHFYDLPPHTKITGSLRLRHSDSCSPASYSQVMLLCFIFLSRAQCKADSLQWNHHWRLACRHIYTHSIPGDWRGYWDTPAALGVGRRCCRDYADAVSPQGAKAADHIDIHCAGLGHCTSCKRGTAF